MSTVVRSTEQVSIESVPAAAATRGSTSARPITVARTGSRRPRGSRVWAGGAVVLTLAFAAWGVRSKLTSDDALPEDIVGIVTRGNLPVFVNERGDLESSKTTEVRCEVEGEQIKITETIPDGSHVTPGQVVIRFDTEKLSRLQAEQEVKWRTADAKAQAAEEDLAVAKNKAESEVAKAKLALHLAKIDLRKYLEGDYVQDKRSLDGDLLIADEELRRAEERLLYSERLHRKGYISAGEVEADRVAVTKAKNTLSVAQEKLRVLEKFSRERQIAELTHNAEETERELERTKRSQASTISKAESDWRSATATAAVEKASLDKLKQQLEHCEVVAPEEGIMVYDRSRPWDTSGRIQPGGIVHFQRVLFSIPDLKQMQAKVKIHESSVKKVKPGQTAELRVDAYADEVLTGTVESVATLAENRGFWDQRGVKEYESVIKIRDLPEEAGLKPGMTADIKILVADLSDVLLVPIQAVVEKDREHYCFMISASGVEQRWVDIGDNDEKFVEIRSGVVEGERVALDARARLHGGKSNDSSDAKKTPAAASPSAAEATAGH
jgi:HlyD family secretion protein